MNIKIHSYVLLWSSEWCPDDKHLTRNTFFSVVLTAFLWLLVANLAISPPHLSTLIGCAATGDAFFCKINFPE